MTRLGSEAGAAGLVAVAAMAMTAAIVAIVLGGVLDIAAAAARARTAADAAALAAAATSPLVAGVAPGAGAPRPAEAAQEVAQANGARLVETTLRDWPLRVGVRVTVQPRTPWARRIVGVAEAGAVAAVRPPSSSRRR